MRPADCLRHLEELTLRRRSYPDAWYNYGVLLAEGGRLEDALQAVEKALEIHPQYVDALFTRVFLLGDLGRVEEAFRLLRRIQVRSPDDFTTVGALGVFFLRHEWKDAGVEQLLRAEKMRPGLPFLILHAAAALAAAGRTDEARDRLEKARAIVSHLEEPRLTAAFPENLSMLVATNQWRDPFLVKAHIIRANFAIGEGEIDAAEADLWEANRRYPGHPIVVWHLAKILSSRGEVAAAKRWLFSAVAMDPDNHLAHFELSWAHAENGELEKAIRALRKATTLRPLYPDYHYQLGTALMDLEKLDEAIEAFRRVSMIHPSFGHNDIFLANAYLEQKSPDMALAALASSHCADWPEALIVAARAHSMKGDLSRARAVAEQALARDPSYSDARELLASLGVEAVASQRG